MKNAIFYFTGTGNSLFVAKYIAQYISDTKLIPISKEMSKEIHQLNYETIGFVFPVYYSLMPKIVKKFVRKLEFNKKQYIFSVVTLGGVLEMANYELSNYVNSSGGLLSSAFKVNMPGNNVASYGAFPNIIQNVMLKRAIRKSKKIANIIKLRERRIISNGDIISRKNAIKLNDIVNEQLNIRAKNFHVDNNCRNCGICEKICPNKNIKRNDNDMLVWGKNCEQCMACIQWCPSKAIQYLNDTSKRKRYHNPQIKLSELLY